MKGPLMQVLGMPNAASHKYPPLLTAPPLIDQKPQYGDQGKTAPPLIDHKPQYGDQGKIKPGWSTLGHSNQRSPSVLKPSQLWLAL